ncbi:SAM-dependent methyltransferase [Actinomadura rifamycini]|uniref:SAM-dependent methyltransferase n=1 Tax=Actinomadura rifamycini TaxID=31962 RepID=UPI00040D615A|nr:SAM-dependent methyltransferase [Actinomadura rifamycini]
MTRGIALSAGRRPGPSPDGGVDGGARFGGVLPNIARMCDYYLGGKDNYALDRESAERASRLAPVITRLVQANRGFLEHAARLLAETEGVRQFADIGCGLPAPVNTADVVRRADPSCRVAYVDNDPMVLAHARALLAAEPGTAAVAGDLRDPAGLLARLRGPLDFDRPVGVLLCGVLEFLTDADDPRGVVAALVAGLPPGSSVALTHVERTPELAELGARGHETGLPFTPRSRAEIDRICGALAVTGPYPAAVPLAAPGRRSGPTPLVGCIGRRPD